MIQREDLEKAYYVWLSLIGTMEQQVIRLEHGSGGRLMRELIEKLIIPAYRLNRARNGIGLPDMDDGASIPMGDYSLVVTTDAYTVKPLFFPGGDLGKLAACGTVNDLAVMGAEPLALTTSIVVEEGFPLERLRSIVESIDAVLREVGFPLIAGDTKVMEHGKIDEAVITATGVGLTDKVVTDEGLKPKDKLIVTGTIGDHEIALLSFREGLGLETRLESNVAPLWGTIRDAMRVGEVTAMKDPTRGGVAGALNDLARKSKVDIVVREESLPIKDEVRGASEMLGIDPLEVTNEGIAILGVKDGRTEDVLTAIKRTRYGRDAQVIGEVRAGKGMVILETAVGGKRIMEEPIGAPIPRVC